MPRKKFPEGEVFHCNFPIPKDVYRKFRLLAAEKTVSLSELYRRAAEDFVKREEADDRE
jgi:hypothetical protein